MKGSAARDFLRHRLSRGAGGDVRKVSIHENNGTPGQRVLIGPSPRFGLPQYLRAEFTIPEDPVLKVTGPADRTLRLDREDLDALPETTKVLDLHCVMTWSVEGTRWNGWSFADLWIQLLRADAGPRITELVFTGLDGAAASIPLGELLRDDVMIAHSCDGDRSRLTTGHRTDWLFRTCTATSTSSTCAGSTWSTTMYAVRTSRGSCTDSDESSTRSVTASE